MCFVRTGIAGVCPTPDNTKTNIFSGYHCINQLTWNTPTSGTNITYTSYTNNDTQRFYRMKVVATGWASCGYVPVNAPELSVNRQRILPSHATIGNTYGDFNVHAGSSSPSFSSSNGLFVLEHQGGSYPCGPTILVQEPGNTGYLMWQDLNKPTIKIRHQGVPFYRFNAGGTRVNSYTCGLRLTY